ncbi:MAG: hypothetical protein ABIP20_12090 [Chthoniobacteraceae bacterium]
MADLPTSYYVHSLIEILHYISDDLLQCDSGTTISELFSDDFDDLDFELALTCFEGTHRLAFKDHVWKDELESFEEKTLEEFVEEYLDPREQKDPLFVTKRFLFYEKSLAAALREEYESPPPGEY